MLQPFLDEAQVGQNTSQLHSNAALSSVQPSDKSAVSSPYSLLWSVPSKTEPMEQV